MELLENHMAVDLITAAKLGFATEDRCLGVYVLDEETGEVETIRTDRWSSRPGGCGKVYLYTTNPDDRDGRRRGDGLARRRRDRKHGVRPVPSDLPFSSASEIISDLRSCARRRRNSAE